MEKELGFYGVFNSFGHIYRNEIESQKIKKFPSLREYFEEVFQLQKHRRQPSTTCEVTLGSQAL